MTKVIKPEDDRKRKLGMTKMQGGIFIEILGSSPRMTQKTPGVDFYRDCFASLAMTEFRNDGILEFPNQNSNT